MSREEFLDASPLDVDDVPPARPGGPRVRRPLNGGWVLMLAAGLIAATANYAILVGDEPSARVAVLAADAPVGTPVEQLHLRMTDLPLQDPGAHLLAGPEALDAMAGHVTATALPEGALLRTTDLRVAQGEGVGAMSIPAEAARAVGGGLQPGDLVDVIAGEDVVGYIARDLAVLAVSSQSGGLGGGGAGTVTLAVDGDDALRLAQALRGGGVDLVRIASGVGGGTGTVAEGDEAGGR